LHLGKYITLGLKLFDVNLFELRVPDHVPVPLTLGLGVLDVYSLKESLALHPLLLGLKAALQAFQADLGELQLLDVLLYLGKQARLMARLLLDKVFSNYADFLDEPGHLRSPSGSRWLRLLLFKPYLVF